MRSENILKNVSDYSNIIFKEKSIKILDRIKLMTKLEIASIMKIKGNLLETTYENIKNFENLSEIPALSLYNGVAFKELEIEKYSKDTLEYINERLYILSAFYGLSKPFTLLKKYRLDMTMKIFDTSLYEFWKKDLNDYIEKELKDKILINLASNEFSKMIDEKRIKNIINIDFKEYKDGKYSSVSSYSKQARGNFLNIMIKEKVVNTSKLKNIEFNNYKLNIELSDDKNYVFTR